MRMDLETQLLNGIVEVTPTWPAEIFIQRHIQSLDEYGISVNVVARESNQNIAERATIHNLYTNARLTRIPAFDHLTRYKKAKILICYGIFTNILNSKHNWRQLYIKDIFRKLKPKLVHFHNAQLAVGMNWICEELGVPYTVSLRGADIQEIPLRSEKLFDVTKKTLLSAVGIHTVCDAFKDSPLVQGKQTTTIYTTVPIPKNLKEYEMNNFGGYRFLSVGRLHWRKGFPNLLIAMRYLLDSGVNASLTIVGTGPDEARIKYWIQRLRLTDSVHLAGKLDFAEIQYQLQHAHAYVQASYAEGISNALAEALACGCPVFATDVAGTKEVVRDGENGFLLNPLYPEKWVEKMRLVMDQELMKRVRAVAYEDAKSIFFSEKHGKDFMEFYSKAFHLYAVNKRVENHHVSGNIDKTRYVNPGQLSTSEIVVKLPWNWEYGTDQILKALAPIVRDRKIRLIFIGDGQEEDELNYLVSLFGLGDICRLYRDLDYQDTNNTQSKGLENLTLLISYRNEPRPSWEISTEGKKITMAIGDVIKLIQAVKDLLPIDLRRK